jgi:hypothetical protein
MATMSIPTQHPDKGDMGSHAIPSLLFDNRTDYDALHFDTLDQYGTAFHVIVAKIGYRLGPCGAEGEAQLIPLEEPAQLAVEDSYYDDALAMSVRQESDLAPYKPRCDVIVNGHAHAPGGDATRSFDVHLCLQRPDEAAPLPERPLALNPLQSLSPTVFQEWQAQLAVARNTRIAGVKLIDKTLSVTGERYLQKQMWPIRWCQAVVGVCTLGLIKFSPWYLTRPQPFVHLPLRYEFAAGGECRIEAADRAASRVAKKYRLTSEQLIDHPNKEAPPIAHDACMTNPAGRGFARRWYLDATRCNRLPAPRIEYKSAPFSASQFWRSATGDALDEPAGLGFTGRAWQPRRKLVGTIQSRSDWHQNDVPMLPEDFDFGYWNGAPMDQQCLHPTGGERFILINMCAPDAAFAHADAQGNTVVRFTLPHQSLFLLGAHRDGQVAVHSLAIDTVVIDADAGRVELVWRTCLQADGDMLEARLHHACNEAQLQRLRTLETTDAPADAEHSSYPLTA